MEITAQREIDLHKGVGEGLKAMGHSTQTIPPYEQPVLSNKTDAFPDIDVITEEVDKFVHGEGPQTYTRGAKGENWRTILKKRISNLKWK